MFSAHLVLILSPAGAYCALIAAVIIVNIANDATNRFFNVFICVQFLGVFMYFVNL